MFYRSLSPIEQAHIAEAFTFELSKVYAQEIKERELLVLAHVDAPLCAEVAAGLGLAAPMASPVPEGMLSPTLSQLVAEPGPVAGRKIGVVADANSDLAGIAKLKTAAAKYESRSWLSPRWGGVLKKGRHQLPADGTVATARSVEFDLIAIAAGTTPSRDIKQAVLLQEAYRHCKPLAFWGDAAAGLEAAGIDIAGPGVLAGETMVKAFSDVLFAALGLHRVWERASEVMASAVPPSR